MLSKLRFFRSHSSTDLEKLRESVQPSREVELLDAIPGSLRRLPGGTLNLAFDGRSTDNRLRCFKTHLTEAGRLLLRREAAILQRLYGERLDAGIKSVAGRDWLVMNSVSPISPAQHTSVTPGWIDSTTGKVIVEEADLRSADNFADIVQAAQGALTFLAEHGEVKHPLVGALSEKLGVLREGSAGILPHICHGDLSPRNVMKDGKDLILLDWEDNFLGVKGYDWIYWLSFFANRHLLTLDNLRGSGLPDQFSCATLVAILLVKCELSIQSGASQTNSISIQDRLITALELAP